MVGARLAIYGWDTVDNLRKGHSGSLVSGPRWVSYMWATYGGAKWAILGGHDVEFFG